MEHVSRRLLGVFIGLIFIVQTLGAVDINASNKATLAKHRVIVSTDIGGTDPDDFQSLVHLLVYADTLEIEGLISSPYGDGRKEDILKVIDCYAADFSHLRTYSEHYPLPKTLREITKQGETERAPYEGIRKITEGSEWLIQCARRIDDRPLHVLVWGGLEDLAQALHEAPDIRPKLRVYWIGGPNKKWSPDAYQYLVEQHPELHLIECNSTYRGWFTGGDVSVSMSNTDFVFRYVVAKGSLGQFFANQKADLKMGDTPSVAWLLHGTPADPSQPGWGGQFVRAWDRPFARFTRIPTKNDQIEVFGILELALPIKKTVNASAVLSVENQLLPGHVSDDNTMRFRFSPKAPKTYQFAIQSNLATLNGQTGAITAHLPSVRKVEYPSVRFPNWWTDDPAPERAEGKHHGAKSISQWRQAYLQDFAARMQRCESPKPESSQKQ